MKNTMFAVLVCVAAICGACGEPWPVEPSCMDGYDQVTPEKTKEILECAGPEYVDYIKDRVDTIILVRGDKCPCNKRTPEGLCEVVGCAYIKDGCRVIEVEQPMPSINTASAMVYLAAYHTPECSSLPRDENEACARAVVEAFWQRTLHCQYPTKN